ncbi:MAG: glycoside hydrolase family 25 protein [Eubacteriales bacterium]|nr:glycoside hydrolase family 25 protein [Eubacteriales bacterium]MDD3289532.1 glycoside hydrolase family 25 protein [Eubacteriales bacterium]MDD3863197.1 glycoside hydrolase family 25 protein [Eubacteriales bacterium]MDD4444658.1 glycoside hydrolase family 25 protein [Eubacteriales bacterium]
MNGRKYIAGILAAAGVLSMGMFSGCTIQPPEEDPADAKPPASEEPVDGLTVTQEEIYRYATESNTVWEFTQRFFTDTIVYKDRNGDYVFAPVDPDLPKSDYNWDNLVELDTTHREVAYVQGGKTLSIKGIDISRYQKTVDWEKAAADGVEYAIIRLGYRGYDKGGLVMDELYEENVRGALDNGVAVGVYFVTQAISVEEAIEEAEFVLENIKDYDITWPVVLDLEDPASLTARTVGLTKQEQTDITVAFCETVREAGYTPMLYCNIRWYMEELDLTRLTEYDKWFAQYFNRPFFPYEYQMWQYTNNGRVDGITGPVDLNLSFVDYGQD